jgi:hypothetical protein
VSVKRLHFPVAFAAEFVISSAKSDVRGRFWKKLLECLSGRQITGEILVLLILEEHHLQVIMKTPAATLNYEVTLRIEATCYQDYVKRLKKKAEISITMIIACLIACCRMLLNDREINRSCLNHDYFAFSVSCSRT